MSQPLDKVRKNNQGLHTGIPVLLRCCLGQGGPGETAVLLEPLGGLNELERICGGHQDLAEQGIRVQGDRRRQAIELLGRQERRLVLIRWRILRQQDGISWHKQNGTKNGDYPRGLEKQFSEGHVSPPAIATRIGRRS